MTEQTLGGLLHLAGVEEIAKIQGSLFEAWGRYMEGDAVDNKLVRPVILDSWERCRAKEVNCNLDSAPLPASWSDPQSIAANSVLLQEALPHLIRLGNIVADYRSAAVLCDEIGRIIAIEGDPTFLDTVADHKNFRTGVEWSEEKTGSNAIGTALELRRPVQVFSAEHYCRGWHEYVCTAAPIHDPFSSKILGVLDVSGTISNFHRHAFGLVLHLVRMMETTLCQKGLSREYFFNREALEVINSMGSEGIVVVDSGGAVRACTAAAKELLKSLPPGGEESLVTLVQRLLVGRRDSAGKASEDAVRVEGRTLPVQIRPLVYDNVHLGTAIRFVDCKAPVRKPLDKRVGGAASASIIGSSPALVRVRRKAEKVAPYDSTVLLEGESGTGKELFARLIHQLSHRSRSPFLPLNCGAIPPQLVESELFGYERGAFTGASSSGQTGKLELAHRGTVFLDEISEMSLAAQASLLRFLQEREFFRVGGTRVVRVDVRIVAATNKALAEEVAAGRFRDDLYYRLKVISVKLPSLREREEDIPHLVGYFLKKMSSATRQPAKRLNDEAMSAIKNYSWPGNVRELGNAIEHAFVMSECDQICLNDLPDEIISSDDLNPAVTETRGLKGESDEILAALQRNRWNISLTARNMGLARVTLYRRMKRHGITVVKHLSHS